MLRKTVSGEIILIVLLMGMLALALNIQPVKASGTIYIRADGSVEGTTSIQTADNVTYVFTANINASIVVERNNIIIDGNGHTLQGALSGTGIDLSARTKVTVQNATIKAFNYGIGLDGSSNNTVSGNDIANNYDGIRLKNSSNNNTVSGNNIEANNGYGIGVGYSSNNNTISGNNITANYPYGILLVSSSNNRIYHNNFIGNQQQVSSNTSMNVWDDGYPSGGNYWSDYTGVDANHDGIGDTPYPIDANNQDRYPLMTPTPVIPEFPSSLILTLLMTLTTLAVAFTKKRLLRHRCTSAFMQRLSARLPQNQKWLVD